MPQFDTIDRDILRELTNAKRNPEIAKALSLPVRVVKDRIKTKRMGAKNRVQLACWATYELFQIGLTELIKENV